MKQKFYKSLSPQLMWRADPRFDWTETFGRRAPLDLEIGMGNGQALVQRALDHPDRNLIGLDIGWPSIKRALRRIGVHQATNARIVSGDARQIIWGIFRPAELDYVYCLFPCPWPKVRHARHRLFTTEFMSLVNNRMKPGAVFDLTTDDLDFYHWIIDQLPRDGFDLATDENPARFGTKYEQRWLDQGQEIFYDLHLTKTGHLAPPYEETVVQGHRATDFDPDNFHPTDRTGEPTVLFEDFLYDRTQRRGLVRTLIIEDGAPQTIWVEIAHRPDKNIWVIHPVKGGYIIPTVGAQLALDLVKETIESG